MNLSEQGNGKRVTEERVSQTILQEIPICNWGGNLFSNTGPVSFVLQTYANMVQRPCPNRHQKHRKTINKSTTIVTFWSKSTPGGHRGRLGGTSGFQGLPQDRILRGFGCPLASHLGPKIDKKSLSCTRVFQAVLVLLFYGSRPLFLELFGPHFHVCSEQMLKMGNCVWTAQAAADCMSGPLKKLYLAHVVATFSRTWFRP